RPFLKLLLVLALCAGPFALARAQDSQTSKGDESWTTTSESKTENTNPSRTLESHSKSGNRSVDKQRVEVLGPDGHYQPDSDTETETIHVNDSTTRTVVRTYRWDGNGRRQLSQVAEEDARTTASGDKQVTRTTSNADVNGSLQVVQREVADTTKSGPDTQQTKSTLYQADGNGGFSKLRQTDELEKRNADHSVEVKKTTQVPDGNGGWQVGEVKEQTIKHDGKNRSTEERIARSDVNGKLSEVSRTVGEETENAAGDKNTTVDTYSTQLPGSAGDGKLQLNRRLTTVQKKDSTGENAEQHFEERSLGNPSDGLQVKAKTKYVVQYAAGGSQQTKSVQARDGGGNFSGVSVETQKSDRPPQAAEKPVDSPPKP
ncbi:MAG: hypothetical protein ABLT11_05740, partial [Candidatus Acidiferrum sp.]